MADQQQPASTSAPATGAVFTRSPAPVYANRGKLSYKGSHNTIACLNTEAVGIGQCKEMMVFLRRSRICRAITADVPVYQRHLEDFWDTAIVNSVTNPTQIIAKVTDRKIVLSEGVLRRVLECGDEAEDRVVLSKEKVRGCLTRCGYPELGGTVAKKFLCPHFKYLAHVLIHCLGSKKSGFDTMNEPLQNAYAALVMNMRFNFSRMIWNSLTEAASNKRSDFDFLLYPRFVQMMINDLRPTLAKEGNILSCTRMDDTSVRYMFNYSERQERPKDVPLWGHLVNEAYLCPPGNNWKNEGSDYEDEVMIVEPTQPRTNKRKDKSIDEAAVLLGVEQRSRKKPNLVFKPRPTPARQIPSTSSEVPPVVHQNPSQSVPPETPVAATSESTDKQISALQTLVINLSNNYSKLIEDFEKMKKEKEEAAEELERVRKEGSETKTLLLTTTARCENLEERLKIMEECYDEQREQMTTDSQGYFRLAGHSQKLPGTDEAGPSGSGTNSDEDV